MRRVLGFGECLPEYEVPVLNEREVRAGAGILFAVALVSFMHSWLLGDFAWTRVFVVAFLADFSIRVLVNPRYAPSLIIGRLAVRRQRPEWVGAPQKRFAWIVGWLLAAAMFWLIVLHDVIGPLNLLICATCLTLLFFESALGICLACRLYDAVFEKRARYCPGDACATDAPHPSQKVGVAGALVVVAFLGVVVGAATLRSQPTVLDPAIAAAPPAVAPAAASAGPCTPPEWAVKIGHAEMWKLHHGCSK
jgi:hypothetical protein